MTPAAVRLRQSITGSCFDCRGSGNRQNASGRRVPCETCDGTGRLSGYTVAQASAATRRGSLSPLSIAQTLDAFFELRQLGVANVTSKSEVDIWRATRP